MTDLVPAVGPGASAQQQQREQALLEALKPLMALQSRMDNDAHRHRVVLQLNSLADLGRTLDRVRGRKHVVLLSEGFDPKILQGRSGTTTESAEKQRAIETGEIWRVDTDNRYGSADGVSTLRATISALRRSDVILHALDIKGVRSDVDAREGVQRSAAIDSLHLLTADTGGTVFRNTNDLSSDFERMLKMQEVTYVLAFSGPSVSPGKFHDLKVKLVDGPAGARVMHRAGYYEPSPAANELERSLNAAEIIVNSIPVADLEVAAMALAFPRAQGPAYVPVVLEVDGDALLEKRKDNSALLEFFVYAFDGDGVIRDFTYQPVKLDIGKVRSKLTSRGVKFFTSLRLEPGDYSVRVLARSAMRNGFASASVHVPSAGERFVMPPLVFDPETAWLMIKAPEREAAPYPFVVSADEFVPAIRPAVKRGSAVSLALFAGADTSPLRLTAALTDANAATTAIPVKFLGRAPDPALIKLVWELQMPQLPQGQYSLVLDVAEAGQVRRVVLPLELEDL
jgi:VWFA-related protein